MCPPKTFNALQHLQLCSGYSHAVRSQAMPAVFVIHALLRYLSCVDEVNLTLCLAAVQWPESTVLKQAAAAAIRPILQGPSLIQVRHYKVSRLVHGLALGFRTSRVSASLFLSWRPLQLLWQTPTDHLSHFVNSAGNSVMATI
jgi:hypothetical protein